MSDDVLKVAADLLMQAGRDEEADWLKDPERTRRGLKNSRGLELALNVFLNRASALCPDDECGVTMPVEPHRRDCLFMEMWRSIESTGNASALQAIHEDYDAAWDAAKAEHVRRAAGAEHGRVVVDAVGRWGLDAAGYAMNAACEGATVEVRLGPAERIGRVLVGAALGGIRALQEVADEEQGSRKTQDDGWVSADQNDP